METQLDKTFLGDSRWVAVRAMNDWLFRGMPFPAKMVREDAYCLAYEIKSQTGMNFPELGEFMGLDADRAKAGKRVREWVENGRAITSLRQRLP